MSATSSATNGWHLINTPSQESFTHLPLNSSVSDSHIQTTDGSSGTFPNLKTAEGSTGSSSVSGLERGQGEVAVAIEKPRPKTHTRLAYIPSLDEGMADLTPELEDRLLKEVC